MAALAAVAAFFYFSAGRQEEASAMSSQVYYTRADGLWRASGVWNQPGHPKKANQAVVKAGHTVTIGSEVYFEGMIDVYGTLVFDHGALKLGNRSKINVHQGGKLATKGQGLVKIAKAKWQGQAIDRLATPNVLTAAGALGGLPTPTAMVAFKAEIDPQNRASLAWRTAHEHSNHYFEVQRSADGTRYEVLAQMPGAGESREMHAYAYLDHTPQTGKNYYRIKQVGFDGRYEYAPVQVVSLVPLAVDYVAVAEEKDKQAVSVKFVANLGQVTMRLANRQDSVLWQRTIDTKRGENTYVINKAGLGHGMYTLSIRQQGTAFAQADWVNRYIFMTY